MPITLPMCPPEALPIGNSCFAVLISDDTFTYFSNLVPFDSHPADDRAAMLLRIGRLAMVSNIPQRDLVDAFGVSRATVQRAQRRYLAEGEAAFLKPRRGRGPSVFTPELVKRATALLEAGLSGAAVARALGVSVASVNKWRRQGLIGRPALGPMPDAGAPSERRVDEEAAGAVGSETTGRLEVQPLTETAEIGEPGLFDAGTQLDRTARDRRDRQAPMGRATCDVPGRVLASSGQAGPVEPQFTTAARGVRFAGVLTALPALLKEGLLAATDVLPALPKGYYGPTAILLFLAFMTLARVRNPESLRYQPPGEWGAILGLDRCPEVKTLRRKIALVAGDEASVRTWQLALAKRWQEEEPDLWATLAVDGHVKVYSGRKGRLPKHFVSREKLCLPASTSYWINALGGKPLLCLHKTLDPKMVAAIETDVVPALQDIGIVDAAAPDLTAKAPGHPALTLVFDREGWSPDLFRRLARRGIACLTWHKNFNGENWPVEDFSAMTVPIHGPAMNGTATVRLAEKPVTLPNGFRVRQIRRLLDNARQIPFIITDPHRPMAEAAGAMFSRWSQENFFKYMRDEFNLDALPTHDLDPLDPDTRVVNPLRRAYDKAIRRVDRQLARLRNRVADATRKKKPTVELKSEVRDLEDVIEIVKASRKDVPKHCRAGDLDEAEQLDALPSRERLLLDVIRMIAYRTETRMMLPVMQAQGQKPHPRKLLRALLTADADILPDPANGVLRVHILGLGNDACDRQIDPLLTELNATETVFPGTDLRMVYEVACPPKSTQSASPQITRGQDV